MRKNFFIFLFLTFLLPAWAFANVVIICNKNVKIDKISKDDLYKISYGKTSQLQGEKINFVRLVEPKEIHEEFSKKLINKNPQQFDRYWKQQLFKGKQVPEKFKDISKLLKYIENTPGAIGYIDENNASVNIKILTVED